MSAALSLSPADTPTSAPVTPRPRLRVLPIPDAEPPAVPHAVAAARALQADLDRERFGPPAEQPTLALTLAGDSDDFGPRPTPSSLLPEPRAWAARTAQVLLEVLGGHRPAAQLDRWCDDAVRATVRRRAALARRLAATATASGVGAPASLRPERRHPVVRSVHVCEATDGVAEASAVVVAGGRVRALALRLEGRDGRWQVTALELG